MKRVLLLSILFPALLSISFTSSAFVHRAVFSKPSSGNSPAKILNPSPFAAMSIREFLVLTPKKYKALTGKKLSLVQKVTLKLAQVRVKKMAKKHKQIDLMFFAGDIDNNNFNIPGFILGIALGPIGILIAYLIDGKGSAMFRWALLGALIWLGIFLLVLLL